MELFLPHLRSLRHHFESLSSDEQDVALGMVLSAVQHMREGSMRRRIHCEAERSLADETERMILEKFSSDWIDVSSTSPYFVWDKSGKEYSSSQPELLSSVGDLENLSYINGKAKATRDSNRAIDCGECFHRIELRQKKGTLVNVSPHLKVEFLRREQNYFCATCGYEANNRKALYRHGQSTRHMVRLANKSGSIVCGLCDFTTNKKYNYDRHLRRVHFSVRSHRCEQCDRMFKDSCTLKGHQKWHAQKLHCS